MNPSLNIIVEIYMINLPFNLFEPQLIYEGPTKKTKSEVDIVNVSNNFIIY